MSVYPYRTEGRVGNRPDVLTGSPGIGADATILEQVPPRLELPAGPLGRSRDLSAQVGGQIWLPQSLHPVVALERLPGPLHSFVSPGLIGTEEPPGPPDLRGVHVDDPAQTRFRLDRDPRLGPGGLLVASDQAPLRTRP